MTTENLKATAKRPSRPPADGTPDPADPTPTRTEDPWQVDVTGHDTKACKCHSPPPQRPKHPCTRIKPKKEACCDRILELLDPRSKDASRSGRHKPKTPARIKLANWCCDWPVRDALAPLMDLMFRRASKGLSPRNDFERDIYGFLRTLDARHADALQTGADAYAAVPESRRCAFETRFDDWPDDQPVDPAFVAKVLLQEIVALGRHGIFGREAGAGQGCVRRLWDLPIGPLKNEFEHAMLTGPWPWICAVNPGADNVKWFRNGDVVRPDQSDLGGVQFNLYEFAITCTSTVPDPQNPSHVTVTCVDKVPGNGGFQSCDGGPSYEYHEPGTGRFRCLASRNVSRARASP